MLTLTTLFKDFFDAHTYIYVQAVFRNVEIVFFYIQSEGLMTELVIVA